MLHVGILAHSADGAALCFLEIVREASRQLGEHQHPEVTLSILPMGPVLGHYDRNDLDAVRQHLSRTAERLAHAGCDFFACPDNTAHMALERPGTPLPLPGLHIAELVAEHARARGLERVGLLGTRWTMEGGLYERAMARHGIGLRTPAASDRELIHQVIFEELCQGVIADASRAAFLQIIERLRGEGCDAVALSCTEIPLLVTPEVSPLPTIDSTRLLARSAVSAAVREARPTWRGGNRD